MLVLSNDDLVGLVPAQQLVSAVEYALKAQQAGQVISPLRVHIKWDTTTLLTMPAADENHFGVKVVTVVPSNAGRELPVTNGVMILTDTDTGIPLAIMNAAALTAQRTGAIGALGVKHRTPLDTSTVGIIGCGVQAAWQAIFACAVRPIEKVFVFSRSMAGLERFVSTLAAHVPTAHVIPCRTAQELLRQTDLVIAATTSSEPVLPDDPAILENKHYISVGSYRLSMQELPDAVYRLARCLAVDSEHATHEVGDVINPLRKGIIKEEDVFSIAQCVLGLRPPAFKTTAYKSVGAAMYDLFVARAMYLAAKAATRGTEISL